MESESSYPSGRRRGGLLWHRDFRLLWIGETVSLFGTQVSILAIPLVAVLTLGAGPGAIGVLVAMEFTAFLVVGLPAGAWVDRWRRRPVMITADLTRFALLASVPIAAWAGVLSIWQLFAVALLQGVGTVFFDVAYQSFVPSLLESADLVEGNAKLQGSASLAQVAGPSFAGYLVQLLSAPTAVAADAVSFLASAAGIGVIRKHEAPPVRPAQSQFRAEIAEGLRVVLRHPILRMLAAASATVNFFTAVFVAVVVVFLVRDVRLAPASIGILLSAGSVGGLAGALSTSALIRLVGQARTVWLPLLVGCPLGLLIPLTHRGWALALFVIGWFGYSFAEVAYNIAGVSLRQQLCEHRLLGRMNATMRFLSWGVMPFGALLGGLLGDAIGPRATLWVTQVGLLAVPVLLLASPLREMHRPPEAAPGSTGPPSQPEPARDLKPVSAIGGDAGSGG
jgi:MFS family permease